MASTTEVAAEPVTTVCRSGEISETVVSAVARATGVDPLELEPLYSVVDPDALNALFDTGAGSTPSDTTLGFSMAGCRVVVHGDGEVVVAPPAEQEEPSTLARREE